MSDQKIRSFIALELSDEVLEELERIEAILKEAGADVKWVKPGSIHLTLKFLGNITEEQIPRITERLKEIAFAVPPFDMALDGIGVFPKWSYAKVLWVGAGKGADTVGDLAAQVEEAMAEEGFEKEDRPFSAHLTLGRIRTSKNKGKLRELAGSVDVRPAVSHISRIVLFRSDLSPKGAVYTYLSTAELSG